MGALPKLNQFKSTWGNVPKTNRISISKRRQDFKKKKKKKKKNLNRHAIDLLTKFMQCLGHVHIGNGVCLGRIDTFVLDKMILKTITKQMLTNIYEWDGFTNTGRINLELISDPVCKLFLENLGMYMGMRFGIFKLGGTCDSYVLGYF